MYSNSTVQHNHIGHIWLYMSIMLYSTHTYPCFSPFQGKVLVPCGTTDEPSPYSLNRKKKYYLFYCGMHGNYNSCMYNFHILDFLEKDQHKILNLKHS